VLAEQRLGRFLDALASDAPAPGGGAAAAMAAALGAALVSMVCRLTRGEDTASTVGAAVAEAETLREEALRLAERDAAAFLRLRAAYRLPKDDEAQRTARSAAVQVGLAGAAEVPLATLAVAARVVEVAAEVVAIGNARVISDIGVAVHAALAGAEAAALNVAVNTASIVEDAEAARLDEEAERLLTVVRPVAHSTLAGVARRIARR